VLPSAEGWKSKEKANFVVQTPLTLTLTGIVILSFKE
jgi:hypothetical protein